MSSTNKTTHYNLPQFIGSDIPTWLGDINSAMTEIDSGINAAATSASGAATTAAQALTNAAEAQKSATDALVAANRCPLPVGFGGFFRTNPNTIYSGTTWEQKKDVFILAAGDTYGAGSTGGEAKHTLTQEEIPNGVVINARVNKKMLISGAKRDYVNLESGEWVLASNQDLASSGQMEKPNQPHNNMPPYFAMPFWIRTA